MEMPYTSISYIWQVTGCQHTMQPTGNDFEAPSIPALTLRGFVRWESIEILLEPDVHVPFLQFAVENWNLTHPETGEKFPVDLPASAFPSEPDADVDRWHKSCAEKLRREAIPKEDTGPRATSSSDRSDRSERSDPRVQAAYVHVRNPVSAPSPRPRPEADYFTRPVGYAHVSPRYSNQRPAPLRSPERHRQGSSSEERNRRRSFADAPSPPQEEREKHASNHLDPTRPAPARRHSLPRHYSPESSESEASVSPHTARRASHHHHPTEPPAPSIRRVVPPPSAPQPPPANSPLPVPHIRQHRSEIRQDDPRRRSFPIPFDGFRDKFSEKMAAFLPTNGGDRPHASSRHRSHSGTSSRRSREAVPTRLSRSWSDLDSEEEDDSDSEADRRRRRKFRERELDSDRSRERRYRERDVGRDRGRDGRPDRDTRGPDRAPPDGYRDEDRDSRDRRERRYLAKPERPENQRRTSSHADVDRRRGSREQVWDGRERDRQRDDRKRWDRRASPVQISGVSGRRYPTEPAYA
jgi:hypothetical protein